MKMETLFVDNSMYYCPDCNKVFKAAGTGKKIKCSQCAELLYDMKISSEDYSALTKEGRESLKSLIKENAAAKKIAESKPDEDAVVSKTVEVQRTAESVNATTDEKRTEEPKEEQLRSASYESFFDFGEGDEKNTEKSNVVNADSSNGNKSNGDSLFSSITSKIPETPINNIVQNIPKPSIGDIASKVPISDIKSKFENKSQPIASPPEKEKPSLKVLFIAMGSIIALCLIGLLFLSVFKNKAHEGKIKLPNAASYYSGKNYEAVIDELEALGFTNITTVIMDDLITGWMTSDGEVEFVSIGGDNEFAAGSYFSPDTRILVSYHTFPEKKEDSDNNVADNNGMEQTEQRGEVWENTAENDGSTESSINESADGSTGDQNNDPNNKDEEVIRGLIGGSAYDACGTVKDMGYSSKYVASNTRMDFTYEIENPDPEYKVNFIVTDIEGLDTSSKNVTFVISSDIMISESEANKTQEEQLREKLDPYDAWLAVEEYGNLYCSQAGVKWKLKWKTGKLAERPDDDDTWFLKAMCTIKAGGGEIDSNCEAKVTGTTDNPQVVYFLIYDLQ